MFHFVYNFPAFLSLDLRRSPKYCSWSRATSAQLKLQTSPPAPETQDASVTALGTVGRDCQGVHFSRVPSTSSKPSNCTAACQCQLCGKSASAVALGFHRHAWKFITELLFRYSGLQLGM